MNRRSKEFVIIIGTGPINIIPEYFIFPEFNIP
jgi:hypothetical protein